jgi:hypothetical protein
MQDGEWREGRGGLLEGGEEGYKMCGECVSTICPSRVICFASCCIYGVLRCKRTVSSIPKKHSREGIGPAERELSFPYCHVVDQVLIGNYYSIDDINKNCLEEFRKHWTCLENNNQQLWQCRPAEWKLNDCVFNKLVCKT